MILSHLLRRMPMTTRKYWIRMPQYRHINRPVKRHKQWYENEGTAGARQKEHSHERRFRKYGDAKDK